MTLCTLFCEFVAAYACCCIVFVCVIVSLCAPCTGAGLGSPFGFLVVISILPGVVWAPCPLLVLWVPTEAWGD